uniref:Salivary lipocalin n=1 Tax=Triatoma matogrossensis TaxID=162370 RepID=E2J728_9HEMI
MKTIIAVVLIGILTYAFAETTDKIEKCQEVSPMENFDSTKLRKGTWFMTRAKNGTASTLCQKFKFEHDSKKNLVVRYGFHISDEKGASGKSGNFQADFVIIATDYENYAIVYRCVKIGTEIIGDNFLILIPNRAAIKHEEIKKLLSDKLNLRLNDFHTRKNQKCKSIKDNMF